MKYPKRDMFMSDVTPSSARGTAQRRWLLFLVVLLGLIGLLVLVFQHSQYLKTQALVPTDDQRVASSDHTAAVDDYTKIEAYCNSQKQQYIDECGEGFPEDDYACRTEKADMAFVTCMQETKIEDIASMYPGSASDFQETSQP